MTTNVFNAQYPKLTPPAVRTNTDIAVLFNTDSLSNLETFHEDFAGKMTKGCFIELMRTFTEDVKHGFLLIDNDPNKPYKEKFFYGLAEILPVDIEHILGCWESWRDDLKQLREIENGTMAAKIDFLASLSHPDKEKRDEVKEIKKDDVQY